MVPDSTNHPLGLFAGTLSKLWKAYAEDKVEYKVCKSYIFMRKKTKMITDKIRKQEAWANIQETQQTGRGADIQISLLMKYR
jgi:hypothetical protein